MCETTTTPRLERETCSRCGGSGRYSYCTMYGTTCFKCGGKKELLTKRGAAAMAFLKDLRSRAARDLKVGDRVRFSGMQAGGLTFAKAGWSTVEKIEPSTQKVGHGIGRDEKGETIFKYETVLGLDVHTKLCLFSCCSPEQRFEVLLSKEEQEETLRAAVAYQATLTKSGTPRKVKA